MWLPQECSGFDFSNPCGLENELFYFTSLLTNCFIRTPLGKYFAWRVLSQTKLPKKNDEKIVDQSKSNPKRFKVSYFVVQLYQNK